MTDIQSQCVLVERHENGFAWLRLNRASAMNALSREALDTFDAEFERLEGDPSVRVIIVGSANKAFCAGADLKAIDMRDRTRDPAAIPTRVQGTIALVRGATKPVLAAINGVALAGGLELAMACDIRIAARGARIGDCHLKAGVIPGAGGAAVLPRLVGPGRAKLMLFTGDLWSADRALNCGLVDLVVDDDDLEKEVEALASRIARLSPLGLALTKRLVDGMETQSVAEALEAEIAANACYCLSEDFSEGISAFAEKRQPRFVGR